MSRACDISGIKTQYGGNRKHKRGSSGAGGVWRFKATRTSRTWEPNLRKARVINPEGHIERLQVAMKTYKKLRQGGIINGYKLAV